MGYQVSRERVYSPEDRYCNGSGLSVLCNTLEEAEAQFTGLSRPPHAYPNQVFLIDLSNFSIVKQTGELSYSQVEKQMLAAWKRRYRPAKENAS